MLALPAAVLLLHTWRKDRRSLPACPLCSAAALRRWGYEDLGSGRVRIAVQCGQCGVWRRTVTRDARLDRHERALRRDRRRMGDLAGGPPPERTPPGPPPVPLPPR